MTALSAPRQLALHRATVHQLTSFGAIGAASTLAYVLLYAGLRAAMPAGVANALALAATAVAMLLGIWLYFSTIFEQSEDGAAILFHAATFLALPVIGLYFSLRCRGFVGAFLWTLAVGLLLPLMLSPVLDLIWWAYYNGSSASGGAMRPSVPAAFCQLVLAVIFWRRLHRQLRERAFHLEAPGQ